MSKVSSYCDTSISYSKVSNMSKFSGCDTVDIRNCVSKLSNVSKLSKVLSKMRKVSICYTSNSSQIKVC